MVRQKLLNFIKTVGISGRDITQRNNFIVKNKDNTNNINNDEEKIKKDMRKKSKITKMVLKLEEENDQYINRNKHILKGYIKKNENNNKKKAKSKEEKSNINEENIQFLQDKSTGEQEDNDDNNVEIDMEKFSLVYKTKNILIKFFNLLLPFEKDIKYIKANYNTTVLLSFRIYRFLFLMSIFTAIIFLVLCILHIVKNKESLDNVCKYGFPCFLLFSSFGQEEAVNISTTYGVWLMFYFICTMIYYFLLSSEKNEKEIYYQNNKKIYSIGSYLTSSWNFNCKDEQIADKNKEIVYDELRSYTKDYVANLDGEKEDKCNLCLVFLAHLAYIAFIIIVFFLIIIFYYLREKMRSNEVITKLGTKDIIADIITYLLIGIFLYLIVWVTGLFPKCEGWTSDSQRLSSEGIKKLITTLVSIFSLLFIISYYTLNINDNKNILPFLNVEHMTFFGCPGKFEDHRHDIKYKKIKKTYDLISRKSYSQCREEDTGITILFIFAIYYIFIFIAELIKILLKCICSCMENTRFSPTIYFIKYYTVIILYSLVIYYIPYFALLFPVIMLAVYKFQFFILKRQGSYSFTEATINKRNNNKFVLNAFIIFNIVMFCIIGYLYFTPLPHFYTVNCYTPIEVAEDSYNILLYNTTNWCGPVESKVRLSSVLTNKMKETLFFGWFVGLFQQLPFIIILISVLLIVLIYRQYNPDIRYYEYIIKRQIELSNTFHVFYEQISKRDILTSMLLKMTQQKLKSKTK